MRVNYPGFNGGDRTSIAIAGSTNRIDESIKTTGKPVVFVMLTGSASPFHGKLKIFLRL
jgi:beta-glucosidase